VIPTLRLVWLAALGLPLALLGLFGPMGLRVAAGYDLVVLAAALADRLAAADPGGIAFARETGARLVQGRLAQVVLHARRGGKRSVRGRVRDLAPVTFEPGPPPLPFRIAPGRSATLTYAVRPRERGSFAFGDLAVRTRGPLGLVERQAVRPLTATVQVYPDLLSLSAREAALVSPSAWRAGYRRSGRTGEGREFHQLRDYTRGDDARLLDWKAFAHRGRPVVRDYRAERNQRVLLLLDAGRLMTVHVGDRLRFDWAAQAAGRLARVALGMGDLVGVAVYSRELKAHLPPGRGAGQLAQTADLLSAAQPDLDEPDLRRAVHALLARNPRRTLVVLFTELSDQRTSEAVLRSAAALIPRHLMLVVTLSDADLERERSAPLTSLDAPYRRAAAEELLQDSLRTSAELEARGALLVRARADALAGETVERYVEMKRLGRL
jgi:uncharacterized protein (DUF58 family)